MVFLILSSIVSAQEGTGEIEGTVFEADGTPAPRARVTLIAKGEDLHRELVTDDGGEYRSPRLPAGRYTVIARSVRTDRAARVNAVISTGQTAGLSITLSDWWTVVEVKALRDDLVAGANYLDAFRNASEITRGQEGGNLEGYGVYAPRGNTSFNSLGQRGQDNNFLLDGMDNNDVWTRGALLIPPANDIESARLVAVMIPASFGHSAGGGALLETPSGSNQFHGTLFDYIQSSSADARNFFDGAQKPGLVKNQAGGNAGGALRKDRWFYFLDAEVERERQGLTVMSTVPTPAQKSGSFGATAIYDPLAFVGGDPYRHQHFAGDQIPGVRIPQPSRNLIALYPDPSLPGLADNYRYNPERIQNNSWLSGRSDQDLSPRSSLLARASYQHSYTQSPGAFPAPAGLPFPVGRYAGSDSVQHADAANTSLTAAGGGITHTFAVRPALVQVVRLSISRLDLRADADDLGLNAASALGIPGLGSTGLPSVAAVGLASLGSAGPAPVQIRTTSFQLEDLASWRTARHNWQFGFQAVRREADGSASEWTTRGSFQFTPDFTSVQGMAGTGDSLASLLLGFPSEVRRDVQFTPYRLRGWEWAGFVQDEVRWGRLSIQLGVRYSLDPPVTEADNHQVNFNYERQTPALDQFAGRAGVNRYGGLSYNKKALAPRVGIAWDIRGSGKTVLRAGFSKTYDTGAYLMEGILARNPPYAARLDEINGTYQVGPNLTAGVPAPQSVALLDAGSLNAANGAIYAIQPQNYTPYSDQWGLFLQHRLRPKLTAEIAGFSSMGIHLYSMYDANMPYPAPAPYAYPRYPYIAYTSRIDYLGFAGGSTYYGGQFKLSGRAAPGLGLQLTYRYAKSLDDATAPGTGQDSRPPTPQFIYNSRGTRSPSPFDIGQRVIVTAAYDLPLHSAGNRRTGIVGSVAANWRVNAVVTAQGGLPFTPELPVNSLNNGGFQLPDRLGSGALPADQRSYLHWFNTSLDPADPNRAFALPALYQYGNSGFDILRGPGMATLDTSLARRFALRERLHLQMRLEAYNILNRTNFALPERILGVASAGVISHTTTPARQLQMLLRVEW